MPARFIRGEERVQQELIEQFCSRLQRSWDLDVQRIEHAVELQTRYCDKRHK